MVISNGDCKDDSSFEMGYNSGKLYQEGKSTEGQVKTSGVVVSILIFFISDKIALYLAILNSFQEVLL